MSIMRITLLNIIIILCVYLNWGCTEGAQERARGKVDYHTVQLSSLSSSILPYTGSNTKCPLHVVHKHKHGMSSPLRRGKATRLDLDNIVRRDRARLDYIQSKLSNNFANRLRQTESKDIPVKDKSKSKSELDSGSYIGTIRNRNT